MRTGAKEVATRNVPPAAAASPPARVTAALLPTPDFNSQMVVVGALADGSWELMAMHHCLIVVSELWNPSGEPGAISAAANQKHRAEAIRRCRSQRIVDAKIAVRFERNANSGGAA